MNSHEDSSGTRNVSRIKRFRIPGLSLRTTMILFTAIIVWLGLRADRLIKEKKIAEMKALLGELTVTDLEQFGIRTEIGGWESDREWEVYLPRGSSFQLCWVRTSIGLTGFPAAQQQCNLPSGYRRIGLSARKDNDQWKVSLMVDGSAAMTDVYDGTIGIESLLKGTNFQRDKQQATDQPLELIRNIFNPMAMSAPLGTANATGDGILIWIEKKQ